MLLSGGDYFVIRKEGIGRTGLPYMLRSCIVAALVLGALGGCQRLTPSDAGSRWINVPEDGLAAEALVLRGRIVDEDGNAIDHAVLRYVPDAATLKILSGALPERDGEFAVRFPQFDVDEIGPIDVDSDGRFEFSTWRSMDRSEENGNSSFVWPSGGFIVTAKGYGTQFRSHQWTQPPEWDMGDVELRPELAVEGTVTDENGQPISDARIRIEHSGTWDEIQREFDLPKILRLGLADETRTAADGRFRMGGLDSGGHHFSIERDGFARAVSWIAGARGMTVDLGRVALTRVEGICGVVHDESGARVPGADVWLTDAYFDRGITPGFLAGPPIREGESGWTDPLVWRLSDSNAAHTSADGNGKFCAFGKGGRSYDLYVVADGFEMSRVEDVLDDQDDVEVGLESRTTPVAPHPLAWSPTEDLTVGSLSVEVVDEAGQLVPGATVYGAQWSFSEGDPLGETSANGVLAAKVRKTGTNVIQARRGGRSSARQIVEWKSGPRASATLTLVDTGTVSGVALDDDGNPDPYAWVSITPLDIPSDLRPNYPNERADAEGRFLFYGLLPGRYEVTSHFRFQGWRGNHVEVRPSESTTVALKAERSLPRLRGVVSSGGQPIVWASVEGQIVDPDRFGFYLSYSLRDGVYDSWVDHLGEYDLTVETTGGGRSTPVRVRIAEGEVVTADIDLPTGGIRGTVITHEDSAPVGGIIVGLFDDKNAYAARATDFTTVDGRFEFSELADGEYQVRTKRTVSYWPDYAGQTFSPTSVSVAVNDGRKTETTLREAASSSIIGDVQTRRGAPARDGTEVCAIRVDVDPPEPPMPDDCSARSYIRSGRFTMTGLNRGVYRIAAGALVPAKVRERGVEIDLNVRSSVKADLVVVETARPRRTEGASVSASD